MMEAVEVVGLCTLSQACACAHAQMRHIAGSLHSLHAPQPWLTGLRVYEGKNLAFLGICSRSRRLTPAPADQRATRCQPAFRVLAPGVAGAMARVGCREGCGPAVPAQQPKKLAARDVAEQLRRHLQANAHSHSGRTIP